MRLKIIVPAFVAALLVVGACHAQIYKWTDDRGLVHYSSTPPTNGEATRRIEAVDERVTIYSASTSAGQDERELALRRRVDALEEELNSQRRSRDRVALADDSNDERRRRELEECQRQRRVDCDRPEVIQNGAPVAVVIGARRRVPVPVQPVSKPVAPPRGSGIKADWGKGPTAPRQ